MVLINLDQMVVDAIGGLDHESGAAVNVDVTATDAGGLSRTETFTINVTNVNETATDITLSRTRHRIFGAHLQFLRENEHLSNLWLDIPGRRMPKS